VLRRRTYPSCSSVSTGWRARADSKAAGLAFTAVKALFRHTVGASGPAPTVRDAAALLRSRCRWWQTATNPKRLLTTRSITATKHALICKFGSVIVVLPEAPVYDPH